MNVYADYFDDKVNCLLNYIIYLMNTKSMYNYEMPNQKHYE